MKILDLIEEEIQSRWIEYVKYDHAILLLEAPLSSYVSGIEMVPTTRFTSLGPRA